MFETLRLLGQLDQLSKIERNARITKGLIGQKVLTAEEIESDKQNGTIRFNPIKTDEFDFLRLCCANVSPVALSATVDKREIPADLLNVFDYVLQRTKQNGLIHGLEGVLNREVK